MAEVSFTVGQIGRSGRMLLHCTGGFTIVAEKIALDTALNRTSTRQNVLTLASPCHQASYRLTSQDIPRLPGEGVLQHLDREIANGVMRCFVCDAPSPYPKEYISRSYLDFEDENRGILEKLAGFVDIDPLQAIVLVEMLIEFITGVWDELGAGRTLRQILQDRPSLIEL